MSVIEHERPPMDLSNFIDEFALKLPSELGRLLTENFSSELLHFIMSKVPQDLLLFVFESTKHFDDSHNVIHALKVCINVLKINEGLDTPLNEEFLIVITMLHDVCDHKYPESIRKSELEEFIFSAYGQELGRNIIEIIDNVSYSKEVKGTTKIFDDQYDTYLQVVADADRLEAIGLAGKVPEDVVKHCHEKLLRLLLENFIKTKPARKMAEPLHQEIEEYVRFQEQLNKIN